VLLYSLAPACGFYSADWARRSNSTAVPSGCRAISAACWLRQHCYMCDCQGLPVCLPSPTCQPSTDHRHYLILRLSRSVHDCWSNTPVGASRADQGWLQAVDTKCLCLGRILLAASCSDQIPADICTPAGQDVVASTCVTMRQLIIPVV